MPPGIPVALQFEVPADLVGILAALISSSFLLVVGLAFLLAIVWLFVPFAVFGIKPRLDRLITAVNQLAESQRTVSEDLRRMEAQLQNRDGTDNTQDTTPRMGVD